MKRFGVLVGFFLLAFVARAASADPITLVWDASPASEQVIGYVLYIGTDSHDYRQVIDVGNTLSHVFPDAIDGQRYFFAIAAYSSEQNYGPLSTEVSGFSTSPIISLTPDPATRGNPLTADISYGPGNVRDWIGLYREGAGDTAFLAWCYLNGTTTAPAVGLSSASVPCLTPTAAGRYQARLFWNNGFTKIATSNTITVSGPTVTLSPDPSTTGTSMTAAVVDAPGNATDWVGFYREGAADAAFLDWCYLNGTRIVPTNAIANASLSCFTPATEGRYQVRLFSNNSFDKVTTSNTVTVTAPASLPATSLVLTPDPAVAGAMLTATVTNAPGSTTDWMGLYLDGTGDSTYLAWCYLNGTRTVPASALTSAPVQCFAPTVPGRYQVRLFSNNTFTRVAASNTITVSASGAPVVSTVTLTPNAALVGATLTATVSLAPGNVTDWLGLYAEGAADTSFISFCYLSGTTTPPGSAVVNGAVACFAPAIPGRYQVRLFSNNSFTRVAVSNTITLSNASVTLNPDPASVGGMVTATISLLSATTTDWIGLYREGESDTAFIGWCYLNGTRTAPGTPIMSGDVACLTPPAPGRYQVRLFSNNTFSKVTTSNTITVP